MVAIERDVTAFWGKARGRPGCDIPSYHPAAYHMLDVAACAEVLLPGLAPQIGEHLRGLAVYLVALHDTGKFTRSFQSLSPPHWRAEVLGSIDEVARAERHDSLGFQLLTEPLRAELVAALPGWHPRAVTALLRAVTGHHGRPPLEPERLLDPRRVFCPACRTAAVSMLQEARALLLPEPPLPLPPAAARRLSWALAGLATLADWIGSSRAWFPYTAPLEGGLAAYWPLACKRAHAAVDAARILPAAPAAGQGLSGLFPGITSPSPVQDWAETVELPAGPVLILIEDVTGSGKTEAAVLLAHRLMAAGRANGLFFALPTMATADAMFARLGESYRRLFASGERPSLVLAHGRRELHEGFHDSVLRGLRPEAGEAGEEPAGAECAAWVAEDRRLAFLADIGAGTVDQALLGVLPSRHAALRLLGLARKVVVVDEAHAYDRYMQAELMGLLRFQAALGGSAVVLSATLPEALRAALAGAFAEGLGSAAPVLRSAEYPLVTLVAASGATETACGTRADSRRRVRVRRLPEEAAALDALAGAAAAGAAAVWVRNTVDEAIAAAEALRGRGLAPMLFHARYAMGDRQRIQAEVLRVFGKDGNPADRHGRVLVATQVVEQSLDLDFDLMVSDLAPVDLLVQRAGRLWRHPWRGARPVGGPELLVLSPEPVPDPPAGWVRDLLPGTAAVYRDPALLWRGARALFDAGEIATPEGVRPLIETAYAEGGEIPIALRPASNRARGEESAHGSLGRQNVLPLQEGYTYGSGAWDPDTRTPTRIGDETTTLRLARLTNGEVAPWCADLDPDPRRAWALSEVAVRVGRAREAVVPPAAATAVERVRAGWPEWDRRLPILVLSETADGQAQGIVCDGTGREVPVRYAALGAGLVFPARR